MQVKNFDNATILELFSILGGISYDININDRSFIQYITTVVVEKK